MKNESAITDLKKEIKSNQDTYTTYHSHLATVFFEEGKHQAITPDLDKLRLVANKAADRYLNEWISDADIPVKKGPAEPPVKDPEPTEDKLVDTSKKTTAKKAK